MAHTRQLRPDSGIGFQVNVLKVFEGVPSSLGSGNPEMLYPHPGNQNSQPETRGRKIPHLQTPNASIEKKKPQQAVGLVGDLADDYPEMREEILLY